MTSILSDFHNVLDVVATLCTQTSVSSAIYPTRVLGVSASDPVFYPEVPYLLVDDVITTGATLYHAADTLKAAGAKEVWVAVIARQPLD